MQRHSLLATAPLALGAITLAGPAVAATIDTDGGSDGGHITRDTQMEQQYYGKSVTAEQILLGKTDNLPADKLRSTLPGEGLWSTKPNDAGGEEVTGGLVISDSDSAELLYPRERNFSVRWRPASNALSAISMSN